MDPLIRIDGWNQMVEDSLVNLDHVVAYERQEIRSTPRLRQLDKVFDLSLSYEPVVVASEETSGDSLLKRIERSEQSAARFPDVYPARNRNRSVVEDHFIA